MNSAANVLPERIEVLGVPIDPIDMSVALAQIRSWLAMPVSKSGCRRVVTPNPEIIQQARLRPEWLEAISRADLALPDGIGVLWAGRRLGYDLPGRVPGIELLEQLLAEAPTLGCRVFFVGGRPGVAERAARQAEKRYSGLQVVGVTDGYFSTAEEDDLLRRIEACSTDVLVTGMGAERDLLWPHRLQKRIQAKVCLGVGGSFDVLAGELPRAPAIVRRLHLEWLFRLCIQPSRWRRALVLPQFVWDVMAASRQMGRTGQRRDAQ